MANWNSQNPPHAPSHAPPHTLSTWQPVAGNADQHRWKLSKVQKLQWSLNAIVFGLGVVSTTAGYKTNSVVVTVCGVIAILGSFLSFIFAQILRTHAGSLEDRLRALEEQLAHLSLVTGAPSLSPPSPPAYSPPNKSQAAPIILSSGPKASIPAAIEEYPILAEDDVRNAFTEAAVTQGMVPPDYNILDYYMTSAPITPSSLLQPSPPDYSSYDESPHFLWKQWR